MKYALLIMLCSLEYNACLPPLEGGFYKTWYECADNGYTKSLKILKDIDARVFNENKYHIAFRCGELEDDHL